MPLLRPNPSSLPRTSIQDLSTFLLSPQTYTARQCPSRLTRYPQITQSRTYSLPCPPKSLPLNRRFSIHSPSLSAPKSHDRGPASKEDTQTDFGSLNVLGSTPAPSTSIDACLWDGFHLNSGVKIVGGSGVLLVAGEAFGWRPWEAGLVSKAGEGGEVRGASGAGAGKYGAGKRLVNDKGQWEVEDDAWGLLGLVWPKPGMQSYSRVGGRSRCYSRALC